jgi:hypothetical protein
MVLVQEKVKLEVEETLEREHLQELKALQELLEQEQIQEMLV